MQTAQSDETLNGLSNSDQLITLATGIVFQRISSLPKADRNDLFELLQGLAEADDEGVESIRRTMLEILSQAPSRSRPMPLDDEPMKPGLKKWADHVGGKIRELREKAGMNQSELAEKAGLTQSHVSRLENAGHSATHMTLEKIARALGVTVGDIDPCVD